MTPAERLHDAITQYVGALSESDFKALVAAARPPADPPASRPAYVDNGYAHGEMPDRTPTKVTAADALAAVRRRHGITDEETNQ